MTAHRSIGRRRIAPLPAAAALAAAACLSSGAPALAAGSAVVEPLSGGAVSGWTQTAHYLENTLTGGEGVATVVPASGSPYELYRGIGSIPLGVAAAGWTHVGDPDSAGGYIVDPYQNASASSTTKMFRVTTPGGATYQYTHDLVPGELYNNSFDAISPDSQWMIAGEWGTMSHLQIYPTPVLNPATAPTGGSLNLAGYVQLDHPVNDIQGCDFTSATTLICASDDSSGALFANQKPLLAVQLAGPLTGANVTGHVVDLGSIPQADSICSGTFEAEGVDYDTATGILRVQIIQPSVCEVATTVYEFKAAS